MNLQKEIMLIDQARYLAAFLGQQFIPSERYRCAISPIVRVEAEVDGVIASADVAEGAVTASFDVSAQDVADYQEIVNKLHAYALTGKSVTALIDAELAKAAADGEQS